MKKVVLMALALGLSLPAMASEKVIDMYKSENCGCCSLWGKAMEKDGFEVRTHVMNDQALSALKKSMLFLQDYEVVIPRLPVI